MAVSLGRAYGSSDHQSLRLTTFSGIYIPIKTDCTSVTHSGHSQTANREENLNRVPLLLRTTSEQACCVPVRLYLQLLKTEGKLRLDPTASINTSVGLFSVGSYERILEGSITI